MSRRREKKTNPKSDGKAITRPLLRADRCPACSRQKMANPFIAGHDVDGVEYQVTCPAVSPHEILLFTGGTERDAAVALMLCKHSQF